MLKIRKNKNLNLDLMFINSLLRVKTYNIIRCPNCGEFVLEDEECCN